MQVKHVIKGEYVLGRIPAEEFVEFDYDEHVRLEVSIIVTKTTTGVAPRFSRRVLVRFRNRSPESHWNSNERKAIEYLV